nr:hypothetical protein [uncultured Marinifilum sp.]
MSRVLLIVIVLFNFHFVIAQNKIGESGNVGINTLSPEKDLDVNGTLKAESVIIGNYSVSKSFQVLFDNVSNQKVDLFIPKYWGTLEISVTGSYWFQNVVGVVTKKFSLGLNPENKVYDNSSRYSEVMGNTKNGFAISDFRWDAEKASYKVTIVCISGKKNQITIHVKGLTNGSSHAENVLNMTCSEIYTTDNTQYEKPIQNFNDMVKFNGQVAIGSKTIDPNYLLDVEGIIRAEEIKVESTGGADFVFEEDYKLKSLEEVEQFVQENKHLPDIPSAKKMEEEGIGLSEMNKLLLQKVEELTLYTITQQKTIKKQKNLLQQFEQRILNLENTK